MQSSARADAEDNVIAATALIFAAAERASHLPRAQPKLSVEILEDDNDIHVPACFEAHNTLSSASSTRRSVAYRPGLPEEMRAAIMYTRPSRFHVHFVTLCACTPGRTR